MSLYKELASMLSITPFRNRVLLFRDEEEHMFLLKWLQKDIKPKKNGDPASDVQAMIRECGGYGEVELKKIPIGTGENGVMIILNAPQLLNKAEMVFFKKESGELLKKMIASMKLLFEECYITNMIKCEITNTLMKPSQIVVHCEKILRKEIDMVRPAAAVVFGDIIPIQKIIKESSGITWFNVEHPITLIKNPDLKRAAWNTMKLVMEKIPKR